MASNNHGDGRSSRERRKSACLKILQAFAWTAIPIVTLSIVSTVGAEYGVSGVKLWAGFYFVWYVAVAVWLVATVAMVVLYVTGKRESASGVLAGVGVGSSP